MEKLADKRQRQLRLHRHAARGAQGARRARSAARSSRSPRTSRSRSSSTRPQVGALPADRLREPHAGATQDFNDDTKDAGEIGAGHTVTALYEIVPAGGEVPARPRVDPNPFVEPPRGPSPSPPRRRPRRLLRLRLRYKEPDGDTSTLMEQDSSTGTATLAEADTRLPVGRRRGRLRHAARATRPTRASARGALVEEIAARGARRGPARLPRRVPPAHAPGVLVHPVGTLRG